MKHFYEKFRFCPHCGSAYSASDFDGDDVVFRCRSCRFDFYQNSAPSATVVIPRKGVPHEVVLILRDSEPRRGLLALPGGFLKYGENPASGARREAAEETGIEPSIERLLASTLVDYAYLGSRLWTLELAFLTRAVDQNLESVRTSEARAVDFHDARTLVRDPARLAFPEQGRVLAEYLELVGHRHGGRP